MLPLMASTDSAPNGETPAPIAPVGEASGLPHPTKPAPASPSATSAGDPGPDLPLDDPEDLFPPPAAEHLFTDLLPQHPPETSLVKRVVFLAVGSLLILIGLVILVLPIIGGAPLFFIPGLILLAKASEPIRKAVNWGDALLPAWARKSLRWARDKVSRHHGHSTTPPPSDAKAKGGSIGDSHPPPLD